jgi:hypothetical protein
MVMTIALVIIVAKLANYATLQCVVLCCQFLELKQRKVALFGLFTAREVDVM